MTLEERLRRYSEKGELVHLSLAFYDGRYHAKLALASTPGGYASAEDVDPVAAIERVFIAAPVKVRTPRAREPERVTATVNEPLTTSEEDRVASLPQDWTTP